MQPAKMAKKAGKAKASPTVVEGMGKVVLISDTTCQDCRKISWEGIYDMLERENPKVTKG